MCEEPKHKSARVFVDGQNLYFQAKEAFGYWYPNYDVMALARFVCKSNGYNLGGVNFYTGVPSEKDDSLWANFWNKKLSSMSRTGVRHYTTQLRYNLQTKYIKNDLGNFVEKEILVAREKGIDIKIAIDVLKCCRRHECNVAIIFSQDQDLYEAVKEIKAIAKAEDRWIKIVSAYPVSSLSQNQRGINGTDWVMIGKPDYDKCLDLKEYFTKKTE